MCSQGGRHPWIFLSSSGSRAMFAAMRRRSCCQNLPFQRNCRSRWTSKNGLVVGAMGEASKLVEKLEELARPMPLPKPNLPRSGDEVAIDQLAVFGRLLLVLAQDLDKAQKKIEYLTWVITILTAVLAFDAILRFFSGH
jgi:hypothetical protein